MWPMCHMRVIKSQRITGWYLSNSRAITQC
jgi:hypothetical protein